MEANYYKLYLMNTFCTSCHVPVYLYPVFVFSFYYPRYIDALFFYYYQVTRKPSYDFRNR